MNDHAELLRSAALRIGERGLPAPELRLVAELSDVQRRNLLLRCELLSSGVSRGSVIIKQVRGDYSPAQLDAWDTRRFFSDWVGAELLSSLDGEPNAARFLAGDRELGFIVLQDLGDPHVSPLQLLLKGNPAQATAALEKYVVRLARLHGSTLGARPRYDGLLASLQGSQMLQPLRYFGQDSAEKLCAFLREIEPLSDELASVIHATVAKLEEPGPFQAFIHGDPCLDNAFLLEDGLLLIDFEMGRPAHALLDAVYVLSPFPTCGCAGHLPNQLAFDLLEIYRIELSRFTSAAADEKLFNQGVLDACSAWLVYRLGWLLRDAWHDDTRHWSMGTSRARILSALEQYGVVSRRLGGSARLLGHAERLLVELRARWPNSSPLPLYPAFRT